MLIQMMLPGCYKEIEAAREAVLLLAPKFEVTARLTN